MSSLLVRIYFNAVCGGLGGLCGWLLFGVFVPASVAAQKMIWLLVGGALIGACIGAWILAVEAIRDLSVVRFARLSSYGMNLGALGGALGMVLGDRVNFWLVAQLSSEQGVGRMQDIVAMTLARGLGWMFLGVAIGACEGLAARSLGKFSYGALGGALGGLAGGALFGLFYAVFRGEGEVGQFMSATGIVILGATIGALTALVQGVFQPASVRVLRGWQEGREFALDKDATVVGRDEHADIALFRDMKIEKRHVYIRRARGKYFLQNNDAPPQQTRVNGEPIDGERELNDGDRIELGKVVLRFQSRSAVNRVRIKEPRALPRPE